MARKPSPCGTVAAYKRHLRLKETPCDACRAANTESQREKRRSPAQGVAFTAVVDSVDSPGVDPEDDMTLIVDTLRTAFKNVAEADPTKLAPIAKEFRAAVEASRSTQEKPKELSLAEQLAEARAARVARTQGEGASA